MSDGYLRDKLIIRVGLSRYPDENKEKLPEIVFRIKDIPSQFETEFEAKAVNAAATSVYAAATSTSAVSFILALLMKASLSMLWGMLNS